MITYKDRDYTVNSIRCRVIISEKPEIRSNLGTKLAEISYNEGGAPVGVVLRKIDKINQFSGYYVSLRGFHPEEVPYRETKKCPDLEEIAAFFGGGGHHLAAGCTFLRFPELAVNIPPNKF